MSRAGSGRAAAAALVVGVLSLLPPSRAFAQAAFTDVGSPETSLGSGPAPVPPSDDDPHVLALPDGRLVVTLQEEFRVLARASSDAGGTYGPEVVLFGGAGQFASRAHVGAASPDGDAYVLAAVHDPGGTVGLQLVHSGDMGQTWSPPRDLLRAPDTLFYWSRGSLALAAGANGRVLVVYVTAHLWYARGSTDRGATWSAPVVLNTSATAVFDAIWSDAVFDAQGRVHVAVGNRGNAIGDVVQYARSLDGGVSFQPTRTLTSSGRYPDVEIAGDGGVLVAYRRSLGVAVVRSADGGGSFGMPVTLYTPTTLSVTRHPRLVASPTNGTVLVVCPAEDTALDGPLYAWRSTDHGASFGPAAALAERVLTAYGQDRGASSVLLRTPAGRWAVGWSDQRDPDMARMHGAVYVRVSEDDGATWGPEQRASAPPRGTTLERVTRQGLAAVGPDTLYVAYVSGRDDAGRQRNVYANRSPAVPLAFGDDVRVDEDARPPLAPEAFDLDLASDGVAHLYAAFTAAGEDEFPDLYVARSTDAGRTFEPPRRVTPFAPGTRIASRPKLAARPGGRVFALYQSDVARGRREIRVTTSADGGATWPATDALLGTAFQPCGSAVLNCNEVTVDLFYRSLYYEHPQLALGAPGVVYAAWSSRDALWFARSADEGQTFTTIDVGGGLPPTFDMPVLCASGDRVLLAFINETGEALDIYARRSSDGGATFAAPERLGSTFDWAVSCAVAPSGDLGVAWMPSEGSGPKIRFRRWDAAGWRATADLPAAGFLTDAVFVTDDVVLVSAYGWGGADGRHVFVSRSTDGGATFPDRAQLDDLAPVPEDPSDNVRLVADGTGHAWAAWEEYTLPPTLYGGWGRNLAMRHTGDGLTWGPLYRMDRMRPSRLPTTGDLMQSGATAALPGVGLVAFAALRDGLRPDVRVNGLDPLDLDRDLAPGTSDCDDLDPGAFAVPAEAGPLDVTPGNAGAAGTAGAAGSTGSTDSPGTPGTPGSTGWAGSTVSYAWPSLAAQAGPATAYDVVTGALSGLAQAGGFADATCLASALPGTAYDDARPLPPPGDGAYVLVRGVNACGRGTTGDGTPLPDPRDALDAMPCP